MHKTLGTGVPLTARMVNSVQTDFGYQPESHDQSCCCRIIWGRSLRAGVFGMSCTLKFLKGQTGSLVDCRPMEDLKLQEGFGPAVLNRVGPYHQI